MSTSTVISSLILLASVLSFAAAAPSKVCGAKAGTDCPPEMCVDAGAKNGKCVKQGNRIMWTGTSMSYPKPADTKNKNCGAAAGTDCPDFVCVDKKHGQGKCTQKNGVWTFRAAVKPNPNENCGAKAGTNCPDFFCVDKKYGKGECAKKNGVWQFSSAPIKAAGGSGTGTSANANAKGKNCGAKAGTNCPEQMCVDKKYNGKGNCTEIGPGKWRWNSGKIPA